MQQLKCRSEKERKEDIHEYSKKLDISQLTKGKHAAITANGLTCQVKAACKNLKLL